MKPFEVFNRQEIRDRDRVRTKTGRHGIVLKVNRTIDTARVLWDDGEEFPIRCCHLEVLFHDADIPAKHSRKLPNG